ncbi:MAG: 4a-hydroxytetrahydrobiopterin dehydratase [Nitrososphaerota archaeon]|nr:4a-hydroxytetrahydrobiopterin dehydratase [Nitrososphaerota archaeon]MDG7025319.1 4a-hydroxytetrahydrobiopterin dehydratase [Nitrososphaerota archaeon]
MLLGRAEVDAKLKRLDGWKRDGSFITKTYEFEEFMDGIEFIREVARVAEEREHHPDIHLRYTKVTLALQTHSAGGVTALDLGLAGAIERSVRAKPTKRRGRAGPPSSGEERSK